MGSSCLSKGLNVRTKSRGTCGAAKSSITSHAFATGSTSCDRSASNNQCTVSFIILFLKLRGLMSVQTSLI